MPANPKHKGRSRERPQQNGRPEGPARDEHEAAQNAQPAPGEASGASEAAAGDADVERLPAAVEGEPNAPAADADDPAAQPAPDQRGDEAPAWRERAAFRVSFDYAGAPAHEPSWRTRAYHEESDSLEEWAGLEGARLLDWMRAHGELPLFGDLGPAPAPLDGYPDRQGAADDLGQGEAAEEPYPALGMGELWLAEVQIEEELGGPRPPRLGPSYVKRVRSQLGFAVNNQAGIAATLRRARYLVQVLACDLATGEQRVLAEERATMEPFVDQYRSVSEFSLPEVGRYRITATVLMPDEGVAGLAVGPVLSVVV
ncbi:MAG TPA: hypothetical protein PKD53_32625 [Chloroflexaceae bacterium]|nr:hypothetical protein [Chloroflexaceae bacterium]